LNHRAILLVAASDPPVASAQREQIVEGLGPTVRPDLADLIACRVDDSFEGQLLRHANRNHICLRVNNVYRDQVVSLVRPPVAVVDEILICGSPLVMSGCARNKDFRDECRIGVLTDSTKVCNE
jgi:hypothetical protein